jgi:multidrug resistance efflux pump
MRAALCLAAAVLFAAGCSEKKSLSFEEKTTRVNISKLQKMVFRHKIPLQGTVMPVEFATISAKISGTVEMLKVDEGDKVKKGDLLCGIDRQVLRNRVVVCEDDVKIREAALESAKLAYRTAEITLSQARRDYEHAKQLNEHKAISISAFDDAEADFKRAEVGVLSARAAIINAESQLKQAHSNLAIAKKNLTDSLITAPFDCVVADKFVEGNEFVAVGQDIFRLENHDSLEVICYISAVYFDRIQPGKTVLPQRLV